MKGVRFILKIHVVQKGDTMWEISKQYGVDFETLKQLNSHIASPDMIMPGMKIKIPSTAKAVKKEQQKKEVQKEAKHPYKDITPKPLPVIHEDDHVPKKAVKPEMPLPQMPQMPVQPIMQMPTMEQNMKVQFYDESSESSSSSEKEKQKYEKQVAPQQYYEQPMPQMQPMPMPMPMHHSPCCCQVVHPCCPPMAQPYGMMGPVMQSSPSMVMGTTDMQAMYSGDCGCTGTQQTSQTSMPQMGYMEQPSGYDQMQPYQTQPMTTDYSTTYPPTQLNPQTAYPTPPGFASFRNSQEDKPSGE